MKKNLRSIIIFCTLTSIGWGLLLCTAITPKQDRFQLGDRVVTEKPLKTKAKQLTSNYTFLAFILLSGSLPLFVISFLIVSNRLAEVELEAEQYEKDKQIRKIRREYDYQTEKELCNANKTVTVTAHEKNLESAFVELASASNWYSLSPEVEEVEIKDTPKPLLSPEEPKYLEEKKNSMTRNSL